MSFLREHASKLLLIGGLYCLVFAGQTWLTRAAFTQDVPAANDFYPRWRGGCRLLWQGESPYSPETTLAIQRGMYGRPATPAEDQVAYAYPLHTLALTWPTCVTQDYAWVQAAWMTLLLHLILIGTILTQRLADWTPALGMTAAVLVWSVFVYPNARALILGQLSVVVFFFMILSLRWLVNGRLLLGGAALALTTIKPQMMLLLVPWLLLWAWGNGRRSYVWSFFASLTGLVAAGLLLVPDWPLAFIEQLQAYTSYTELGSGLWIMTSYYLGTPQMLEYGLTFVVILLLLWLWWRGRRADSRGMLWLAGITLLVTHFVSPRTATTHFIVLLLPTFMIFESWRRYNPAGSRGWVLLTLVLTLVGSWVLFLLTVQGNQESAVNYLPLPLALAAALWAVRSDWLPRLRGVQ